MTNDIYVGSVFKKRSTVKMTVMHLEDLINEQKTRNLKTNICHRNDQSNLFKSW